MKVDEMVSSLCSEIDILREDRDFWLKQYQDLKEKYDALAINNVKFADMMQLALVAVALNDEELAKHVAEGIKPFVSEENKQ